MNTNRVELNMTPELERLIVRKDEPVPQTLRRPDIIPAPRPLNDIHVDARLLMCTAYTSKFMKQGRSYDDSYAICRALGFHPQECVDARQILRYRHEHPVS